MQKLMRSYKKKKVFELKNSNLIEKHKGIPITNTLPFKIKSQKSNNSDKNSIRSKVKGRL